MMHQDLKFRSSMRNVIFYDGSLYFVVLAILNVLQIVFYHIRLKSPFVITADITLFANPIASILVSHFLLNLRRVNHRSPTQTTPSFVNSQLAMPMPALAEIRTMPSFVASFRGPVCSASDHPDSDEDSEGESRRSGESTLHERDEVGVCASNPGSDTWSR
ncbi:hypothetical protein C8Q76DRAFT_198231 [Earliella scabrosa]|nr:hypothetical protein C8Q76DRAFT_198231 [Earliella scabrosa]